MAFSSLRSHPRPGPRARPFICIAVGAVFVVGCVAPATQMGSVSQLELRNEQLRQQELVITSQLQEQQRVENIGWPLLRAALPLCGPGATALRSGVQLANVYTFNKEYQPAARALGFTDTATIVGITKGSRAEASGLAVGDRVLDLGGQSIRPGKNAVKDVLEQMTRLRYKDTPFAMSVHHAPLTVTGSVAPVVSPLAGSLDQSSSAAQSATATIASAPVTRDGSATINLPSDTVCAYNLTVVKDNELNAFADGSTVYVTSGMMRFANDEELAVVVSHEIAHNAMHHMDAKKRNAGIGAFFGAILDVAAASQGVNTQGGFTNDFAALGSQVYSQDFEREADYVGMYILARAGLPFEQAPDFWRRMGEENPGSIKFASSHPTSAERFLRLDQTVAEIKAKEAAGLPLMPEMKDKSK